MEDRIGPVEPGKYIIWTVDEHGLFPPIQKHKQKCWLTPDQIPIDWFTKFPSGAEIVRRAVAQQPHYGIAVDKRLLRRRDCEFELFRSIEEAVELPLIQKGFHTVGDFIARAQTILQRRKSRFGHSLELHTREIFIEEGLVAGKEFTFQPMSESGKHPDFIFPSQAAYHDLNFPTDRLRMLAVKTTCKDRWRQMLNEADRIPSKHLLTLQEGVSENQFREMTNAGVQLVVPEPLISMYPSAIRTHLMSLESFMADVRQLTLE